MEDQLLGQLTELIVRHYVSLSIEDEFFNALFSTLHNILPDLQNKAKKECYKIIGDYRGCEKEVENYINRELFKFQFSRRVSEPVRLGIYRTLFFETHRLVHGELSHRTLSSLTVHGILTESLKIRLLSNVEKVHTGIDFVIILKYPYDERSAVVPLFIIAKTSPKDFKKVMIRKAINRVINTTSTSTKIKKALEEFTNFTRIALLRTTYSEHGSYNETCILDYHEYIPVYTDLACSILRPVFIDIYNLYTKVVTDEELVELSIDDWIEVLPYLAVPITQIAIAEGANPPSPPGRVANLNNILEMIHQETINRIKNEVDKTRKLVQDDVNKHLVPRLRQNINDIIEKYRYEGMIANQNLLAKLG